MSAADLAPSTLPAPPDDAQPVSTALLVALGAFLENVYGSHGLVDAGLRERARELRGLLAGEVDP